MYCPSLLHSRPIFFRDAPAPAVSQSPTPNPFRTCFGPLAQNPQRSPDDAPGVSPHPNPSRSLPRCSDAATGTSAVPGLAPPPQLAAPKNAVSLLASRSRPLACASANCPAGSPPPAALSGSQTGMSESMDPGLLQVSRLFAETLRPSAWPFRPGSPAYRFRAVAEPAFRFPAPNNSGTSKPAAPAVSSSLSILPEYLSVFPSAAPTIPPAADRNIP